MTDKRKTLDDLFNELPPHPPETKEERQRREAKEAAEREKEIRLGWRDANGDWIDHPETDDDEPEEEGSDNDE
jgi:hypothetical protein